MNKIELLIGDKEKELKLLEQEMSDALTERDEDYKYASKLLPIIQDLKREITRLKALGTIDTFQKDYSFPLYIRQIIGGDLQSLELHANVNLMYTSFKGCILNIRRMKAKNTVKCTIIVTKDMEQFLSYDYAAMLGQIGWQSFKKNTLFHLKFSINTSDNMEFFYMIIARTMLEPFSELIKISKQYYLLIK